MSRETRRILVCDDNIDHLMLIKRELERHPAGFSVKTVTTARVCLEELARERYDVALVDYLLRDMSGLDLLGEIVAAHPRVLAIMITGMGSEDVAAQAMKCGAADYVIKSTGSFAVVPLVVARALERQALLDGKRALEAEAGDADRQRLLGAVSQGVAHDLNVLLAAIVGRVQLAQADPDRERAARHLQVAATAAADAARIVRRILDFDAPAAGASAESVGLAAAVADCLEFTRPRWESEAAARGIAYRLDVDVPDALQVSAAPAVLREVVTNLVLNALEAMPEGGALLVRGRQTAGSVTLSIQDTGVGMDEETVARLTTPGAVSPRAGGRGVGFATSLALLAGLGGQLKVDSEPDVGTTCTLTLPRAGQPGAAPPAAGLAGSPPGLRVLIVDNEPRVASLFEDILAAEGQLVATAFSGEEAMSKFEPGRCDVVFCDLSLPGMSGLEVARAIRELDAAVAIVVVTGWGGQAEAAGAETAVVDFVGAKPLDVERIRELTARAAALATARRSAPASG